MAHKLFPQIDPNRDPAFGFSDKFCLTLAQFWVQIWTQIGGGRVPQMPVLMRGERLWANMGTQFGTPNTGPKFWAGSKAGRQV